jgi:hypothetical protein
MSSPVSTRVLILLRARLHARREGAGLPIAALLMQAFVTLVLCGIVHDFLPPFAYVLFALCVHGALIGVPLLGELGDLLVLDEAEDWVRAMPVTPFDVKGARLLHFLITLAVLSLGSLVPAALIAPLAAIGKLGLIAAGLGQALVLAALLLCVMVTLGGRAQALLVFVQTVLFIALIVGAVLGMSHVRELTGLFDPTPALATFPPAWFAAPFARGPLAVGWNAVAPLATLASLLLLVALPAPNRPVARKGATLLGAALTPFRKIARLIWVRRDERASFELVFDALPKEREFVLRSYPLIGIPLAFLLIGAGDSDKREGLLALLLFTPGTYLPILLAHVHISTSHAARWILDSAPIAPASIQNGVIKAVAVRFLLPLFSVLALLCWTYEGPAFALRLVPVAFLVSIFVMRQVYGSWKYEPPLSTAPEDLEAETSLFQTIATLGFILMFVALAAWRLVDTPLRAGVVFVILIVIEVASDRVQASRSTSAQPTLS